MRTMVGLLSALLLWAAPGSADPDPPHFPRLRPLDARAAETVQNGLTRSPTFKALVGELERSDVVVYVYVTPYLSPHVSGGLSFVGVSASLRFVKIALHRHLTPDQTVYILAHELHHALEIARTPEVRTQAAFNTFYRHAGIAGAISHTFETTAAQAMGQRVRLELVGGPGTIDDPRR